MTQRWDNLRPVKDQRLARGVIDFFGQFEDGSFVPTVPCAICQGTGRVPNRLFGGKPLNCMVCRGTGKLARRSP